MTVCGRNEGKKEEENSNAILFCCWFLREGPLADGGSLKGLLCPFSTLYTTQNINKVEILKSKYSVGEISCHQRQS